MVARSNDAVELLFVYRTNAQNIGKLACRAAVFVEPQLALFREYHHDVQRLVVRALGRAALLFVVTWLAGATSRCADGAARTLAARVRPGVAEKARHAAVFRSFACVAVH